MRAVVAHGARTDFVYFYDELNYTDGCNLNPFQEAPTRFLELA